MAAAAVRPKFQAQDLVWAKMKGYPHWPAKVMKPPRNEKRPANKLYIFFYGTHEHAWMAPTDILPYLDYKAKYYQPNKKTRGFADAIEEIEKDLSLKGSRKAPPPVTKTGGRKAWSGEGESGGGREGGRGGGRGSRRRQDERGVSMEATQSGTRKRRRSSNSSSGVTPPTKRTRGKGGGVVSKEEPPTVQSVVESGTAMSYLSPQAPPTSTDDPVSTSINADVKEEKSNEPVEGWNQGVEPSAGGSKAAEDGVPQEKGVSPDTTSDREEHLPEAQCVMEEMKGPLNQLSSQEAVDDDGGRPRRYSTRQRNHTGSLGTVRRLTQSYEARREAVLSPVRGSGLAKLTAVQAPPPILPTVVTHPPDETGKTRPPDDESGKTHPPVETGKTHPPDDGPGGTHPPVETGKTHPPDDGTSKSSAKPSEAESTDCSTQKGCAQSLDGHIDSLEGRDQSWEGHDQSENLSEERAEREGKGETREGEMVSNGEMVTEREAERGEEEEVREGGDVEGLATDEAAVNGEVRKGGESMETANGRDGGEGAQGPSASTPDRDGAGLQAPPLLQVSADLTGARLLQTLNYNLMASLTIEFPNVPHALKTLNQLQKARYTSQDLTQVPGLVGTIRKVRRYQPSEEVQSQAEAVYTKFKSLFVKRKNPPNKKVSRMQKVVMRAPVVPQRAGGGVVSDVTNRKLPLQVKVANSSMHDTPTTEPAKPTPQLPAENGDSIQPQQTARRRSGRSSTKVDYYSMLVESSDSGGEGGTVPS